MTLELPNIFLAKFNQLTVLESTPMCSLSKRRVAFGEDCYKLGNNKWLQMTIKFAKKTLGKMFQL